MYFFLLFSFFLKVEIKHEQGERQREWEKQGPLWTGSPMWGLILDSGTLKLQPAPMANAEPTDIPIVCTPKRSHFGECDLCMKPRSSPTSSLNSDMALGKSPKGNSLTYVPTSHWAQQRGFLVPRLSWSSTESLVSQKILGPSRWSGRRERWGVEGQLVTFDP